MIICTQLSDVLPGDYETWKNLSQVIALWGPHPWSDTQVVYPNKTLKKSKVLRMTPIDPYLLMDQPRMTRVCVNYVRFLPWNPNIFSQPHGLIIPNENSS